MLFCDEDILLYHLRNSMFSIILKCLFILHAMQLRRVKISNVLSFPYQDAFATFEGVIFDTGEKAVTNTLI